jgi:hypothetical protein
MHGFHRIQFASLTSESWAELPDVESLGGQISQAILAHSAVTEEALGFYRPPDELRELVLTQAVHDQIRCMWHGHRSVGRTSPPPIPLRIFVYGFGQENGKTWAKVEVHPGLDNWQAPN